ncbi:MAG: hypothetical protein K2X01_00715 [Cyanobacteria bacterium]|nr:hypothetical protein [Cyanobacteriota bacterium]
MASNIGIKIAGIAAAAIAGWMVKDRYNGNAGKWMQQYNAHEMELEYDYMKYGFGHYSGRPGMDGMAHGLKRQSLFGPGGVLSIYSRIKTQVEGFVNDVLLTPEAAITAGGLYMALGKKLFTPFKFIGRVIKDSVTKPTGLVRMAGKGIMSLLGKIKFGNPGALIAKMGWGAPLVALALGYFAYTFYRVNSHEEQHDYWRDFTSGASH